MIYNAHTGWREVIEESHPILNSGKNQGKPWHVGKSPNKPKGGNKNQQIEKLQALSARLAENINQRQQTLLVYKHAMDEEINKGSFLRAAEKASELESYLAETEDELRRMFDNNVVKFPNLLKLPNEPDEYTEGY